jgi:hypothetical protein
VTCFGNQGRCRDFESLIGRGIVGVRWWWISEGVKRWLDADWERGTEGSCDDRGAQTWVQGITSNFLDWICFWIVLKI